MSEGFTRLRVRQVSLPARPPAPAQRITQCNARVGERGRVEDEKPDAVGRGSMNPRDQLGLGVALEGHELVAGFPRQLRGALFDGFESVRSVDTGLATAQQVEIRSVEKKHSRH